MNTENQLNLPLGESLKKIGMDMAARSKEPCLVIARRIARTIANSREDKTCCIDDVQVELKKLDVDLGMAAGSVFKSTEWIFIGTKKTQRPSSHARNISLWRLK